MKTRIRSFFMAMLLVLSMTATTLAAGTDAAVGFDLQAESESGTVVLDVYLTAEQATNGRIVINFDAQTVGLLEVRSNFGASATASVNPIKEGEVAVAWVGSDISGTVQPLELVFEVKASQYTPTVFSGEVTELYNSGTDLLKGEAMTDLVELIVVPAGQAGPSLPPSPPVNPNPPVTPNPPVDTGDDEEVTTNPDGSTTTTTTDKDGTVTETTETKDGTTATVVTDKDGNVTEMTAEVSEEAAADGSVTLPIEVEIADTAANAVPVEITVPASVNSVTVEVPVKDVTAGTVIVLVDADGNETILPTTAMTEDGLAITVDGSVTVKVVDNTKTFTDGDAQAWASEAITFVTSREIFNGMPDGTFAGKDNMTRAMLMTVLARLDGMDTEGGSTWYEKSMEWAKAAGISDGSNPTGNITREQLATMLYRYAGEPKTYGSVADFSDAGEVSSYAENALKWAVENGIIDGMGDGILAPKGEATRAQLAKILMFFINL